MSRSFIPRDCKVIHAEFDDIRKAVSKKAEPVVLMNAGLQTEVSMSIALALQ
jgi:PHP family Zn ribbon phosphoesterase